MRLTMVGCRREVVVGEVKSIMSIWRLSSCVVVASTEESYGGNETRVDLCSPALSFTVFTKLVNTLSPSKVGGCLVRIGLVLWREFESENSLGGGDFVGE